MTYEIAIGDRTYSSWSLRGWLLFAAFDLPVKTHSVRMYSAEFEAMKTRFAPSQLVPAAILNGDRVWDTLAIAEELATRHPDLMFWPKDPKMRGFARSLAAEMHSGFADLRSECTMNLRHSYPGFSASPEVLRDCQRIEYLWERAQEMSGGPWLLGDFSVADVFYAPVATRFATYHLPRGQAADAYINLWLAHPDFRRWRAMGLAENYVQPGYDLDIEPALWPGPALLSAQPIQTTEAKAENALCPYSADPVTHFLALEGRHFGFCNAFCRDKTLADPEAWPEFMKLYNS